MYQAICTHSPQQQPTILNICNYWLLHWWDTKVSNSCNTSPNIISELQSVQFSCSVVSNSLWPHGRTPGFPVHHQLPELVQTHVHWVSDAIQPSHSLSSPSAPAFNLSQHQGLFQWVSYSHQVATSIGASAPVLPMNIQDWLPLGWTGWISWQSKGLSRVFSTVQEHQFFSAQLSL